MRSPLTSRFLIALAVSALIAAGCGRASRSAEHSESAAPLAPSAASASPASSMTTGGVPGALRVPLDVIRPLDVNFPPRDQPFDFGNQLNVLYRDQLRRGSVTTFVDLEGF